MIFGKYTEKGDTLILSGNRRPYADVKKIQKYSKAIGEDSIKITIINPDSCLINFYRFNNISYSYKDLHPYVNSPFFDTVIIKMRKKEDLKYMIFNCGIGYGVFPAIHVKKGMNDIKIILHRPYRPVSLLSYIYDQKCLVKGDTIFWINNGSNIKIPFVYQKKIRLMLSICLFGKALFI